MREALWKPLGVPYLLAFGVLIAVVTAGCAQNGGGEDQPSDGQTAVTERTQGSSGQEEETTQDQRQPQQRESTREGRPSSEQQSDQQTITVRITGTQGLTFAGRVGTAQDLRRVQGSVPEEYEIPFEGAAVAASVRKQEPQEGTLGVEVVRDGEVVASRESSTLTGVVNVIWTSQQEQGSG